VRSRVSRARLNLAEMMDDESDTTCRSVPAIA
jgi:hypothetical protein